MKFSKLALVIGMSTAAVTHAEITASPMIGYHFFDRGDAEYIQLDDAPEVSMALGYRLNPHIGLEVRYGFSSPESINVIPKNSYTNHSLSGDAYYRFNPEGRFQPYVLTGLGINAVRGSGATNTITTVNANGVFSQTDLNGLTAQQAECEYSAIVNGKLIAVDNCDNLIFAKNRKRNFTNVVVNVGAGSFFELNDNWAMRGEVRATADLNRGSVDSYAGLGLTYSFLPAKPVVDGDDDQDGVLNSIDQCPNTPTNLMVDNKGCPLSTVEYLTKRMNVYFDSDQWQVKSQYFGEIEQVAKLLRQHPEATVEIQGHTDSTASDSYNLNLSERRAQAIANVLVNEYGISQNRVSWKGYGESKPIADNATEQGRALNRRSIAKTSIKVRVAVTKPSINNFN